MHPIPLSPARATGMGPALISRRGEPAAVLIEIRADREQAGAALPLVDGQIAAIAIAHGPTLVTRNRNDFMCVPGLRTTNWRGAA